MCVCVCVCVCVGGGGGYIILIKTFVVQLLTKKMLRIVQEKNISRILKISDGVQVFVKNSEA